MDFRWWEIINGDNSYFIIVTTDYIAKVTPEANSIDDTVNLLEQGQLPDNMETIAFSQTERIFIQEGTPFINVVTKQENTTAFPISSVRQRFEVFDYLNNNSQHQGYELVKNTGLKAAKWPIIIALVASALFGWLYYLSDALAQGKDIGQQPNFIKTLAEQDAQLLSMIYIGLMGIMFIFIFRKLMSPSVNHVLTYRQA